MRRVDRPQLPTSVIKTQNNYASDPKPKPGLPDPKYKLAIPYSDTADQLTHTASGPTKPLLVDDCFISHKPSTEAKPQQSTTSLQDQEFKRYFDSTKKLLSDKQQQLVVVSEPEERKDSQIL